MEDTSKRVEGKQTALFRAQSGGELKGAGGASPVHPHLSITPVVESPVRQGTGETQDNFGFVNPNTLRVRSDSVSSKRSVASTAFSGNSFMDDYMGTDFDWFRIYCQDKRLLEDFDTPDNRAFLAEFDLYMKNTCLNLHKKNVQFEAIQHEEKKIIRDARTCFRNLLVIQRAVASGQHDKVSSTTAHKERKEFNAEVVARFQAGDLTEETIRLIRGDTLTSSNLAPEPDGQASEEKRICEERVEGNPEDYGVLLDQQICKIAEQVMKMTPEIRSNYRLAIKDGIKEVGKAVEKMKMVRAKMMAQRTVSHRPLIEPDGVSGESAAFSPATSQRKRSRSSPELQTMEKRSRRDLPSPPQATQGQPRTGVDPPRAKKKETGKKGPATRKKEGAPPTRWRNDAVVVKPGAGKSYADALRDIRQRLATEETVSDIAGIRKTRSGHVLIEIPRESQSAETTKANIKKAAQLVGEVREVRPTVELELRDLEAVITKEEVERDLKRVLVDRAPSIEKMRISKENSRGVKMAIFEASEETANLLFQKTARGRLKIGMICSELRRRAQVPRCYKCLGYGHLRWQCSSIDRTNMCFKCGSEDHKGTQCTSAPKCVLCQEKGLRETGHIPGTGKCTVYREALQKTKAKKPRGPEHRSH